VDQGRSYIGEKPKVIEENPNVNKQIDQKENIPAAGGAKDLANRFRHLKTGDKKA
jgi:hypothetical protein